MQVRRLLPLILLALAPGCKSKPTPPTTPDARAAEPRLPKHYDVDCKPLPPVVSTCGEAKYPEWCSCRDENQEAEQVDELYQHFAWDAFIKLHIEGKEPLYWDWVSRPIEVAEKCEEVRSDNPWLGNTLPNEGYDENPPVHNPIWDQNSQPVDLEVRFIDGTSASVEALGSISQQVRASCMNALHSSNWGHLDEKQPAAARLKLVWKKLGEGDRPGDFITDQEGKRGLVAMHIAMVTMTTRGWWVWATFGHVNNVPDDANDSSRPLLFFDTGCGDKCPPENKCPEPCSGTCKTQIKRVTPIPKNIRDINIERRTRAPVSGTPLERYQLIGVQRVKNALGVAPRDFGEQHVRPGILANEIIEWDRQESSCIGCHVKLESWGFPDEVRWDVLGACRENQCKCIKSDGGRTATCRCKDIAVTYTAELQRHKKGDKGFFHADMFGLYHRVTE